MEEEYVCLGAISFLVSLSDVESWPSTAGIGFYTATWCLAAHMQIIARCLLQGSTHDC
eukprot:COSAG02_NODE_786_length_17199_cov_25.278889_11_plen_58_part_00